ncbi:N-acetylglucosamine kinase [Lysinibacillus telephonicus]|uniref:N-acetylglucosamine kinase n=1 Tax=Lysinibacillus telephonicus TaxID=1714840 RepID=A0A431UIB0_9BACI|nr:BadF/BadG/BcrA/BcrD ATPase family protein [Lysinibacillus telephonicus]RTQ89290.1 N-acetylglucosamine kinase [Lysinibacillus telephonicus]
MKEKIILAVDGGATKTTLSIRSEHGECYFEKTSTGSNAQTIGAHAVKEVLNELLWDAYQSTNLEKIDVAAFAIAGIDSASDLKLVSEVIEFCCQKVPFKIEKIIIENDVHSALLGLVGLKNPGALIISGTGSICMATDGNGYIVRTGGWGHRAGDEGSGYWIGKEILSIVFRMEDGRLEKTSVLKEHLYKKLHIETTEQLITWLYQPNYTNAQIASISSILQDAVILGDEQAIAIARQAAKELYFLVKSALQKINYVKKPLTLYVNGGVLQHNPIILNLLQQYTVQTYPDITFTVCDKSPIEYIFKRALFSL